MKVEDKPFYQVLSQAGIPALLTWLLIPLSSLNPRIDSTIAPYFDLTQPFAQFAYWLSFSGGTTGIPFVILLMLILLISRTGISSQQRWKETCIIVIFTTLFAGGGALFNEHVLKPQLKLPRPNIMWLAENGALGITAEELYAIGNKKSRRVPLINALNDDPLAISPQIKAHWVAETGYSLPSGHALSAMFAATFLLMLSSTLLTSKRRWIFYLLLPWALAVCYSRPILRVHTPLDIIIGGFQGLVLGFLAWFIAQLLIRRMLKS